MKQIRFVMVSIIILVDILFSSCKRNPVQPAVSERMQLLTTGQWKMAAYKIDNDNDGLFETDSYISLPLCVKDNYTIYKKDGIFEWYEGIVVCDPAFPGVVLGDWRFANNEQEIWLNGGPWQIAELNSSVFRIKGTLSINGNTETTYIK